MKSRFKDLFIRYGLSVVVYVVAFFLTNALWKFLQPAPVPLFFAAIIAAFLGGFGPGLFISIVSALTIDFYFVPPYDHFEWTSQNLVRIGVFVTVSSLISWLNGTRKRLMDERGRLLVPKEWQ
jgi:K+-sensing histidine kinase KdpD